MCPEYPGYRIPNCKCQVPNISPFLQIRWKRLVIDEGHVSSSLSSILVPFAKLLSVERRWIVTGTPTTNLLGLSLGNRSSDDGNELQPSASSSREHKGRATKRQKVDHTSGLQQALIRAYNMFSGEPPLPLNGTAGDADQPPSEDSSLRTTPSIPDTLSKKPRIWNKYDREDLNKLGNMIAHFIALPQFIADSKLMSNSVVDPLLASTGPQPGAVQVLNQLMETVMIRHRLVFYFCIKDFSSLVEIKNRGGGKGGRSSFSFSRISPIGFRSCCYQVVQRTAGHHHYKCH
jgi:hypothetical protein